MTESNLTSPFLKWVGGKRQIIPEIKKFLPENLPELAYYEPFIGGGALLFRLQPKNATINDYNGELVNVYRVIKNDVEALINDLKKHRNETGYFYEIRSIDRSETFNQLTDVEKASRVIYLNKTCYNGLYRVNSAGEFNTPFGSYKKPNIVDEAVLRSVNRYLNTASVRILNGDYALALEDAPRNSFVYLDPPYHPLSESSRFTGYVQGGWTEKDQIRLKQVCDSLHSKNIKFLLSNSSAKFIRELYDGYHIHTIQATRTINSNGKKRGRIDEFLIRNYD